MHIMYTSVLCLLITPTLVLLVHVYVLSNIMNVRSEHNVYIHLV